MDQKALTKLSYGVYVVSVWDKGRPTGCIANSCMQITSSPATLAVSVHHDNYTNQCMKDGGFFGVSVLSESVDPGIIGTFGYFSGKDTDKFEKIPFAVVGNLPMVKESCAKLSCKVIDTLETSTHTIFIGEVTDAVVSNDQPPMTYAYYHNVIKGKSPKNAPTYQKDE